MKYSVINRFQTGAAGFLIILMLFGCASANKTSMGQKYEDSKSWLKEKWSSVESKFSSSDEDGSSLRPHDQNPDYLVYRTQSSDENLSGIAEWFTGDSENWKALANANPKVRPNRIAVETPIMLPAKLVKVKTLPTEAFVAEHRVKYFEHKVRWHGETLSLIAKWYTGNYGNWKALAKANPGLNPNRIVTGDIIHIPPAMMKTEKPLPFKFVAKSSDDYFAHTVRRTDEKLSEIAEWYTGSLDNDKRIAKANPDIDPDLLLVGNEIYIPSPLLKTRIPMHQRAIQISASEQSKKPSAEKSAAAAPKKKKMQLFGPKQFPTN